jgi:DNA-binding NtrC family response regulator
MVDIIGRSKRIEQVRASAQKLSRSKRNIIILGEPGAGKSDIAEKIHQASSNSKKPCVSLTLDSIDEAKFLDVVDGIITDRHFRNPLTPQFGSFRLPAGSCLVIEHVDHASLLNQRYLCRLIESAEEKSLGLRFMLIMERPPAQVYRDGRLHEGLHSQLRSWGHLEVPPLRERPEDIPQLVEYFVKELGKKHKLGDVVIDINAMSVLIRHEWKGNVRELKESIERSILESEDKATFNIPKELVNEQAEVSRMLKWIEEGASFSIDHSLDLIERRILERVLGKFELNQSRAAEFLRITEDTLRYRMKRLGIPTAQQR